MRGQSCIRKLSLPVAPHQGVDAIQRPQPFLDFRGIQGQHFDTTAASNSWPCTLAATQQAAVGFAEPIDIPLDHAAVHRLRQLLPDIGD